ncbi:MAG: DUF488 domain-containing protein [Gemmatimonadetes bacterium]|nr:DUF488 domain-containing protein [Gemmatimonadota bacterium]
MPPPPLHTVGHSTRSADDFVALLRAHGVRTLVDVRRYPGSRRHPQFNREALARTLEAAGIAYRHEEDLGGRRGTPVAASPNAGWRNASFRAYADHTATPAFREALDRILDVQDPAEAPVAVMCAEAVPWRCHRQLIADAAVARGREVRHILSAERAEPHALNPMGRVVGDGVVVYPPEGAAQGDLFG